MRALRRRNPSADDYAVLLDAIEEDRADARSKAKIVALYEQLFGGAPTTESIYELGVKALEQKRDELAERLYLEGRALGRWVKVPSELQRFVVFDVKSAKDEVAKVIGEERFDTDGPKKYRKRLGIGRQTSPGIIEIKRRDDVDGTEETRWFVFRTRAVAEATAFQNAWNDVVFQMREFGEQWPRDEIKRRAKAALDASSIGEYLGIAPQNHGIDTPSGFVVFDNWRFSPGAGAGWSFP